MLTRASRSTRRLTAQTHTQSLGAAVAFTLVADVSKRGPHAHAPLHADNIVQGMLCIRVLPTAVLQHVRVCLRPTKQMCAACLGDAADNAMVMRDVADVSAHGSTSPARTMHSTVDVDMSMRGATCLYDGDESLLTPI